MDAIEVLLNNKKLCNTATVIIDGAAIKTEMVLRKTEQPNAGTVSAEYGILASKGHVTRILLGENEWLSKNVDFDLAEATELVVTLEIAESCIMGGECNLLTRALLGQNELPKLYMRGELVPYARKNDRLVLCCPEGGSLVDRHGNYYGSVGNPAQSTLNVYVYTGLTNAARKPVGAGFMLPQRAIPMTLGSEVASDGTATFDVDYESFTAKMGSASLCVVGATHFDACRGVLYALSKGCVTDGHRFAPAPKNPPKMFKVMFFAGAVHFFYLYDARYEVWNFEKRKLLLFGSFVKFCVSEQYIVGCTERTYEIRNRSFKSVKDELFQKYFDQGIVEIGCVEDLYYGVTKSGTMFCGKIGGEEYAQARPLIGEYPHAQFGSLAIFLEDGKLEVCHADYQKPSIDPGVGEIKKMACGSDGFYVWGSEGTVKLVGDNWLCPANQIPGNKTSRGELLAHEAGAFDIELMKLPTVTAN